MIRVKKKVPFDDRCLECSNDQVSIDRSMKTRLFHSMVSTIHFIISIRSSSGERRGGSGKGEIQSAECEILTSGMIENFRGIRDDYISISGEVRSRGGRHRKRVVSLEFVYRFCTRKRNYFFFASKLLPPCSVER